MIQANEWWHRLTVIAASAIAIGLGSCTSSPTANNGSETAEGEVASETTEELQVVTTFLPITQFTNAVVGDRAEVTQLIPASTGPHDYQAKPEDAQALANADVLVKNGLEMEFFLDDLIDNAGNPDLTVIDSSQGIATLSNEGHDHDHDHAEGDHDHDHDHAEGEDHDHDHDHAEGGHHHHHGEFNPHIWLDPKRAIEQVENIRDGLIAADPEGEPEYEANAAAYIERLQALDADITEQLAPYAGQTFVVFHDFAPYFADSYNLESEVLVDVPEENPSPEDVKRVIDTVKAANLKTILTEPQAGDDAFSALAKDLDVEVGMFNPIETGGSEALEPDYYLTVMRQNTQNLVSAFDRSTQSRFPLWMPQPAAVVPQAVGVRF
jgi:zinc/manganese transport system substrate-binding protein